MLLLRGVRRRLLRMCTLSLLLDLQVLHLLLLLIYLERRRRRNRRTARLLLLLLPNTPTLIDVLITC